MTVVKYDNICACMALLQADSHPEGGLSACVCAVHATSRVFILEGPEAIGIELTRLQRLV